MAMCNDLLFLEFEKHHDKVNIHKKINDNNNYYKIQNNIKC